MREFEGMENMNPESWLISARQGYPLPLSADLLNFVSDDGESSDSTRSRAREFRANVCDLICDTLRDEDHALVQSLTEQEILAHENDDDSYVDDNLVLCARILFKLGHAEDSLLVWRAKNINFDTETAISVELIAGAGIEQTLAYLQAVNSPESQAAHEYFMEYGELDDFESFRRYNDEYFGDK